MQRSLPALFSLVAAAATAFAACGSQPVLVDLSKPAKAPPSRKYRKVLERWTRHKTITVVEELNTTLRIHATLRSPEFDAAFANRWQELFRFPEADVVAWKTKRAQAWEAGYSFVIAAATHSLDANDFDKKDSQWRLSLVNDREQQVTPDAIEAKRRITATDTVMFPQLGMFYRRYDVHFPRNLPDGQPLVDGTTKRLMLRVAGPLGFAEMTWHLKR